MKQIIGAIWVVSSLMLLHAAPVSAHEQARGIYHQPAPYKVVTHRGKHTPAWLKRNSAFKRWYRRSPLQHNRRLSWPEVYQVYRWERYSKARRTDRYYADHSYAWYQRHWAGKDRFDRRSRDDAGYRDRSYRDRSHRDRGHRDQGHRERDKRH